MNLATIVLDEIVFLATASDNDINPDVAVSRLESVAHGLKQVSDAERRGFAEALARRIEHEAGEARAALVDIAALLADE